MRSFSVWRSAALLLWLISPLTAAPVTAPYSIVFTQYPSGAIIPNLIPSHPGTGTDLTATIVGGGGYGLDVTNVAGRDFELSTHFGISGQGQVGLLAFSDTNGRYQLLLNGGGLFELSGADTTRSVSVPPINGDL